MKLRLRRAVFLALLALGAMGLLATGSGVWSGSPWPWLVVLALAVVEHVAGDHYDQRQRLARRTASTLRRLEETVDNNRRELTGQLNALGERIDAVGTPEGMKAFRDTVQRMAHDLSETKEVVDSVKAAGGLRSLLGRRS